MKINLQNPTASYTPSSGEVSSATVTAASLARSASANSNNFVARVRLDLDPRKKADGTEEQQLIRSVDRNQSPTMSNRKTMNITFNPSDTPEAVRGNTQSGINLMRLLGAVDYAAMAGKPFKLTPEVKDDFKNSNLQIQFESDECVAPNLVDWDPIADIRNDDLSTLALVLAAIASNRSKVDIMWTVNAKTNQHDIHEIAKPGSLKGAAAGVRVAASTVKEILSSIIPTSPNPDDVENGQ